MNEVYALCVLIYILYIMYILCKILCNTAHSIVEYHTDQSSTSADKWFRGFSVCVWKIWKWESDFNQWRHL